MSGKSLTLGVFGFGCVGSGLYETLRQSNFKGANIKRFCIANPDKERSAPNALFTTEADELLNDPEIDVIVELIDNSEAAYQIVTKALRNGKAVVTANKKLLAEHLQELIALQDETGQPILYEGAAAASIPIIRNLEEYYDNDLLREVSGILNGSTNFILSAIEDGGTFDAALELAQKLGFAESDPTLDVDGWDAKFKLTILLAHAFGIVVEPSDIPHVGITRISPQVQRIANERRERVKLVGKCWREDKKVFAHVIPTFVTQEDELNQVENEVNGVVVEGAFSQRQFFRGKGAGSFPTAAAVLSDISALTYDYRYEYKKLNREKDFEFVNDHSIWVHVSGNNRDVLPLYAFEEVVNTFRSPEHSYVEGRIGLRNLINLSKEGNWSAVALSSAAVSQFEKQNNLELAN
ncbi:homoserine dehydrogenase [Phaeocystidibacter luteus]|uniref:Homoserine dehydrogenase n=1 Tax=Phaeocystidibacter luteus TaxID=911197 RepID=A0A6N6RM42_9FLAO|nr:homoserine dehydrogenase [Phaeocystidibacter luteus]KAB2814623.1 homoserine dehydrogenase [Phaeocystidibacter luteus]